MAGITAVGVHDDLTAGQTAVTLRATHHKTAGGVDVILGVFVQQLGWDGLLNDFPENIFFQLCQRDLGAVLAGNDHRVHAGGLAVHIFHRHLALAVGAQVIQRAVFPDFGQAAGQLVGHRDGKRHQLRSLIAGVTEHHTLIAGAGHLIVGAQRDVGALAVNVGDDAAGVTVKAVLGTVIANAADDIAGDAGNVHIAVGGDLTHDVDKAGGAGGLTGHAGTGVLLQNGIQYGVGDLVADLVGMPFGDRFGREQNFGHSFYPP